ncbi:hypothetical protein J2W97_002411 [Paenibacillus jamilae]|nr:hypothetical protein [Paenibacillus jamilae]
MSDQCTQVIHKQEGGQDIVKIYDASGIDTLTGTWPVNAERSPLESAVDALWSGYFEVQDRRHLFGKYPVAVASNVNEAVGQFVKEFEGEELA